MNLFDVPKEPLFNGEDLLPALFREDPVAADQWLFEKHYANSEFALGVPFRERFFRGAGMLQYQFFRGDAVPPGWIEQEAHVWWEMERSHWQTYGFRGECSPFVLYFRDWCFSKAAPNAAMDLWASDVNPWLDRYLEFAPMSPVGF
jgi:hypothetical protein